MATVTKPVTVATLEPGFTEWTNKNNALNKTVGDNVYATAAPAKNGSIFDHYFPDDFTSSDIPDGATINSVTIIAEWKLSALVTGGALELYAYNVVVIASTIKTTTVEEQTSIAYSTVPSLSDLRSASTLLNAQCECRKGNTNTALTGSLDFVSFTVDYTATSRVPRSAGVDSGFGHF